MYSADKNQWNRDQQLQLFADTSANADQQLARIESLTSSTQASIQFAKLEQQGLAKQYQAAGAKRDELKRLGSQTLALEVQIAELQSEDLIVFRDQTVDGRQLVLVDVGVNSIALSDALSGGQVSFKGTSLRRDFERWLANKQLGVRQFLILIRPGAANQFEAVRKSLDATSAAYGFDVLATEKKVRLASQGSAP